jgi:hypothetical protein
VTLSSLELRGAPTREHGEDGESDDRRHRKVDRRALRRPFLASPKEGGNIEKAVSEYEAEDWQLAARYPCR